MTDSHHYACGNDAGAESDFAFLWHCEDSAPEVGESELVSCALTTVQKKFGSKSLDTKVEETGSYARGFSAWQDTTKIGYSLTGDFTYDFWAYPVADGQAFGFSLQGASSGFVRTSATSSASSSWRIGFSSTKYSFGSKDIDWPLNTWGHVAVIRQGDTHYITCNGKVVYYLNDNTWFANLDRLLYIGGEDTYYNTNAKYIDEVALRLFAAWDCTGAVVGDQVFTPPTAAYTG